jgi:hypothetical protein
MTPENLRFRLRNGCPPLASNGVVIARASAPLILFGSLALASCHGVGGGSKAEGSGGASEDAAAKAVSPVALPPPCVEFLGQFQCWLRAAGNAVADIGRAVGNARASFEARPQAAEACERAMVFRAKLIASAGCAHPGGDARNLPLAVPAECPPGEHFFVRSDGHVSGCHRDCTVPADCPVGASCISEGSAADGPIDEPFCE